MAGFVNKHTAPLGARVGDGHVRVLPGATVDLDAASVKAFRGLVCPGMLEPIAEAPKAQPKAKKKPSVSTDET